MDLRGKTGISPLWVPFPAGLALPPGEDRNVKFHYTIVVAVVTGEDNRRLFGLKQLIYDVKLLSIFGEGMYHSFLFLTKVKTLNI